ncbi:peroxisomal,Acyl-coenzyme A oxidase 2 [Trichinella spiralis]|uniref:Peroxisomal,Acyl-coenzyme A oxidase 2 n=1 Tax=Trichinella spiralis TaxID=6334 RepID=A0ABR3K6H3_TRISP
MLSFFVLLRKLHSVYKLWKLPETRTVEQKPKYLLYRTPDAKKYRTFDSRFPQRSCRWHLLAVVCSEESSGGGGGGGWLACLRHLLASHIIIIIIIIISISIATIN